MFFVLFDVPTRSKTHQTKGPAEPHQPELRMASPDSFVVAPDSWGNYGLPVPPAVQLATWAFSVSALALSLVI